jgi:3-phosphoshikimate 1-carboxyvinyltransferase
VTDEVHHVAALSRPLDAVVAVPGSKSIANRALVCAALAAGTTVLRNVPHGDDSAAMLGCVAALGAGVEIDHHDDTVVTITGTGGTLRPGPMSLHAGLAGTTSRFVTALAALGTGHYEIDGHAPLRARPMGPLHEALAAVGAGVDAADPGHLPVTIEGLAGRPSRPAATATVRVRGDVSSQYITALMLIGPYLPGGLGIELTTPLVSRPYVTMTAAIMRAFGAGGVEVGSDRVIVAPGRYAGREYDIEPDASSASYPLAAAALCGGRVTIEGLGTQSLQGDAAFAGILGAMGCRVEQDAVTTTVTGGSGLNGIDVDMADRSDLVPTLAVVAAFADGPTTIDRIGFIRKKESDRIGDLAAELRRCGVGVDELPDGLRVRPAIAAGAAIDTHHDHRLAMAFGVMGLRAHGMRIHHPDVVSKSWPGFWAMLDGLVEGS